MIVKSFLRLLCAGGLVLLGAVSATSQIGIAIGVVGLLWGMVELFILSALLLTYGLSGIAHDIGAINEHDPWHRW